MQVKSTKCLTMTRRLKHQKPEDDEQVLLHSAVSALETVSKRACYQQQNENSIDKLFANYVAAEIATVKQLSPHSKNRSGWSQCGARHNLTAN